MPKMSGWDGVSKRLRDMGGPGKIPLIGKALYTAANMVAVDAQISITHGAKTGRIYTDYFATINGRVVPVAKRPSPHQASADGEAPADDTGTLANLIESALVEPLKARVTASAPYSADLEYGTSKIAARPFMAPAVEKNRQAIKDLIAEAVRRSRSIR